MAGKKRNKVASPKGKLAKPKAQRPKKEPPDKKKQVEEEAKKKGKTSTLKTILQKGAKKGSYDDVEPVPGSTTDDTMATHYRKIPPAAAYPADSSLSIRIHHRRH